MVSADVAGSLVYGSQTVLLLLVASRLRLGAGGYGYLLAAQGVGGIAGATLAGRLGPAAGRRSTLAVALVMVGAPAARPRVHDERRRGDRRRSHRRGRRADRRGRRRHPSAADARRVSARLRLRVRLRRVGRRHRGSASLIAPVLVSIAGLGGALYLLAGAVLALASAVALRGAALATNRRCRRKAARAAERLPRPPPVCGRRAWPGCASCGP